MDVLYTCTLQPKRKQRFVLNTNYFGLGLKNVFVQRTVIFLRLSKQIKNKTKLYLIEHKSYI